MCFSYFIRATSFTPDTLEKGSVLPCQDIDSCGKLPGPWPLVYHGVSQIGWERNDPHSLIVWRCINVPK